MKIFATMAMIMMMSVGSMSAQPRSNRGGNEGRGTERTYQFSQNDRRVDRDMQGSRHYAAAPAAVRHDIRGYEDRVRFHGGRWHYLRDGRWYGYDHFIEPAYFYSHPLSTFGKVMATTAAVATVATLISALAR